jgi:hypothetical protein
MKRTKWTAIVVLTLLAVLALTATWAVYAQDGGDRKGEDQDAGTGVEGQGLNDPPPAGMTVLYTFTGARTRTAAGEQVATVVHCSNYGTEAATTRVEIYDWNDSASATFSGQISIGSNRTRTFATANTQIYDEDVIMTQPVANTINQGSGRVMSTKRTLICTAQVLDPMHAQPYFMINLDLYRH